MENPHDVYIDTHQKPFNNLRISIFALSGKVVYGNMLPVGTEVP